MYASFKASKPWVPESDGQWSGSDSFQGAVNRRFKTRYRFKMQIKTLCRRIREMELPSGLEISLTVVKVKFHFKAVNGKKIQNLSFELNQLGSMATRTLIAYRSAALEGIRWHPDLLTFRLE